MFATIAHPTPLESHFHFLPSHPSPLSPRRNANMNMNLSPITPRPISMSPANPHRSNKPTTSPSSPFTSPPQPSTSASPFSLSPTATTTRSPPPNPTTKQQSSYATRYLTTIHNPSAAIARQHASSLEKRRDVFLNKVKRDRDAGRFDARGEQIQRMDYLKQRRRYQEAIMRSAPDLDVDLDLDEGGMGVRDEMVFEEGGEGMGMMEERGRGRWGEEDNDRILDEFISQEEEEFQAFLEQLENPSQPQAQTQQQLHQQHSPEGSQYDDEEDYDHIFVDLLDHDQGQTGGASQRDDSMDMSHG
ncbi:hypothetical protein FQN52_001034 [Onygenales sp. PD_12]|nr:hypothetical protein FQN52_001034 [Onygenales sp. PD_12]